MKYDGAAPDLGCFEVKSESGISNITISRNSDSRLHAATTRSGSVIVTVDGADATESFRAVIYDIAGRVIGMTDFAGHTATLTPSAAAGSILLVRVYGENFDASLKIKM